MTSFDPQASRSRPFLEALSKADQAYEQERRMIIKGEMHSGELATALRHLSDRIRTLIARNHALLQHAC